ncbi:uncharacterized protein LOC144704985 [Wolffia australiana]
MALARYKMGLGDRKYLSSSTGTSVAGLKIGGDGVRGGEFLRYAAVLRRLFLFSKLLRRRGSGSGEIGFGIVSDPVGSDFTPLREDSISMLSVGGADLVDFEFFRLRGGPISMPLSDEPNPDDFRIVRMNGGSRSVLSATTADLADFELRRLDEASISALPANGDDLVEIEFRRLDEASIPLPPANGDDLSDFKFRRLDEASIPTPQANGADLADFEFRRLDEASTSALPAYGADLLDFEFRRLDEASISAHPANNDDLVDFEFCRLDEASISVPPANTNDLVDFEFCRRLDGASISVPPANATDLADFEFRRLDEASTWKLPADEANPADRDIRPREEDSISRSLRSMNPSEFEFLGLGEDPTSTIPANFADQADFKFRRPGKEDPTLTVRADGADQPDFEFRRIDGADSSSMLPADQLFSDGKLIPLQRPTPTPPAEPRPRSADRTALPSSRWRDLIGLRKTEPAAPSKTRSPRSLKHFLHLGRRPPTADPSLDLPLLAPPLVRLSSGRASSTRSAGQAVSPRMNSSGKVVFHGLARCSSNPGSFNGARAPSMERSYSANVVRVAPVLNVGSAFGFGLFSSSSQRKERGECRSGCHVSRKGKLD